MADPARTRTHEAWLGSVRGRIVSGEAAAAQALLTQALTEYPASTELRRAQAGLFQQAGQAGRAEDVLRRLLAEDPGDTASAFSLTRILKEQGRMAAAAAAMRACLAAEPNGRDADLAIAAVELLDDCKRHRDALAIAEDAITVHPADPRLHAYAGMFAIQVGEFERARAHYLFALDHDARAFEWHVPIGLSSTLRYADSGHPDFARFRDGLQDGGLSKAADAELHFALGKAHDDIGNYAEAAAHFRQGNALRHQATTWSRKAWRRATRARLASQAPAPCDTPANGFTPVFIVGMPRTGTTLLAELLSRYSGVCNRGELPTLARMAQRPALNGDPEPADLRRAAAEYTRQARQDDADRAHWFLDKQPLNFRYVDLALALFPGAKVVHCRRNPRDTALSLWMQCFLEEVQGYSYDFADIALVMGDCARLMEHWRQLYPDAIREIQYEALVSDPDGVTADLAAWIGLPPRASRPTGTAKSANTISTASLWQARQPVHTRSVERWKNYAPWLPELARFRNAG